MGNEQSSTSKSGAAKPPGPCPQEVHANAFESRLRARTDAGDDFKTCLEAVFQQHPKLATFFQRSSIYGSIDGLITCCRDVYTAAAKFKTASDALIRLFFSRPEVSSDELTAFLTCSFECCCAIHFIPVDHMSLAFLEELAGIVGGQVPDTDALTKFLGKHNLESLWQPIEIIMRACFENFARVEETPKLDEVASEPVAVLVPIEKRLLPMSATLPRFALGLPGIWFLHEMLPVCYTPTLVQSSAAIVAQSPSKLPPCFSWQLLYDSDRDGISFARFEFKCFSYKSPNILLIAFTSKRRRQSLIGDTVESAALGHEEPSENEPTSTLLSSPSEHVLLIGVDTEWRLGARPFGGASCFILSLKPSFQFIRSPDTHQGDMITCNLTNKSVAKGITIRDPTKDPKSEPILAIDSEFYNVTFQGIEYKMDLLQVIGCGDMSAMTAQTKQKAWEEKDAARLKDQKLINNEDWDGEGDKAILEMAGIERGNYAKNAGIDK